MTDDGSDHAYALRLAEYERRKREWARANPEAGSAEYERAMRRIARECGA